MLIFPFSSSLTPPRSVPEVAITADTHRYLNVVLDSLASGHSPEDLSMKPIHRGRYGQIYSFYTPGAQYAVKWVERPWFEPFNEESDHLLHELEIGQRLSHPSFVRPLLLARHEVPNKIKQEALLMEYVPGRTLETWMIGEKASLWQLITIEQDLLAAVFCALNDGVIPRDVHSSNILIQPDGMVRIVDYGRYKLLSEETKGYLADIHYTLLQPVWTWLKLQDSGVENHDRLVQWVSEGIKQQDALRVIFRTKHASVDFCTQIAKTSLRRMLLGLQMIAPPSPAKL